jgi:hypothetical protein
MNGDIIYKNFEEIPPRAKDAERKENGARKGTIINEIMEKIQRSL